MFDRTEYLKSAVILSLLVQSLAGISSSVHDVLI